MSPGLDSFQLKTCSITSYRSSNENNRWHNLGTFCLNFQLSSQTRADKSRRLLHRRMARRRPVWNETLCRWRLPCSRDDVDVDNVTDEEAEQASVCRWESSRSEACSCFWLFCKTSASFKFRWWLLLFVSLSDKKLREREKCFRRSCFVFKRSGKSPRAAFSAHSTFLCRVCCISCRRLFSCRRRRHCRRRCCRPYDRKTQLLFIHFVSTCVRVIRGDVLIAAATTTVDNWCDWKKKKKKEFLR